MSKYGAFILGEPLGPTGKEKEQRKEFPEDLHDRMEEKTPEQAPNSAENGDPQDINKEEEDEKLREVVNTGLQQMEKMMNTMKSAADDIRNSVEVRKWWNVKIVEDTNEEAEKKKEEDDQCILDGIEERVKNAGEDISKSVEPNIIEKMAESTKEKLTSAADYIKKVVQ